MAAKKHVLSSLKLAGGVVVEVVRITAALATEWLEGNTHNRPINDRCVGDMARDIKNGKWHLTHQGIAFDKAGVLIDGQHRLYAVVEAGMDAVMLVTYGLPLETQIVIDGGVPRLAHHFLHLTDKVEKRKLREKVGCLRAMLKGVAGDNVRMTHQELEVAYHRWEEPVTFAVEAFEKHVLRVTQSSVFAVVARAATSKNISRDDLKRFANILCHGAISSKKYERTALQLRDVLLVGPPGGGVWNPGGVYRRTQAALHAFLDRRCLQRIVERTDELFPLPHERHVRRKVATQPKPRKGELLFERNGKPTQIRAALAWMQTNTSPGQGVTPNDLARELKVKRTSARSSLERGVVMGWYAKESHGRGKCGEYILKEDARP